ncbi:MAG: hypothetical protein KAG10_00160 [Methylococcales bacterium]|nr:hypothetical protein [Methylococcales bacterium]MCK5924284.1 hypothetical protein [Methylococcales bacterium]
MMIFTSTNLHADNTRPSSILSVITGDWNQDKKIDAAVLTINKQQLVELYIFLNNDKNRLRPVFYKEDIVWVNLGSGGTYLETASNNSSFFLYSDRKFATRDTWSQKLTISYRNQNFIMSGYFYNTHDTLGKNPDFNCDINFLTGKGFVNKKAFKIAAQKIKLTNWSKYIPNQCTT